MTQYFVEIRKKQGDYDYFLMDYRLCKTLKSAMATARSWARNNAAEYDYTEEDEDSGAIFMYYNREYYATHIIYEISVLPIKI